MKYLVGGWNHGILWLSHHIGNGMSSSQLTFTPWFFQRGGWLNHQPVLALPMVKQKHWNSSWKLYPDVFLKGSTISWDFTNEWNPHDGEILMFKKLEMVMKSSSQPVKNYWRLSRFCIFLTQKVHPTKIPCDFFLSWIVTTNWWCTMRNFMFNAKICPFPAPKFHLRMPGMVSVCMWQPWSTPHALRPHRRTNRWSKGMDHWAGGGFQLVLGNWS